MQKRIILACFAQIAILAAYVGIANSEPLTEKEIRLRSWMINISKQFEPQKMSKSEQIISYAKNNDIPVETVIQMAISIADESCTMFEVQGLKKEAGIEAMKCNCMLSFLSSAGDLSVLPFLENKCKSTNDYIRIDASLAYIRLAGTNSAALLRRAAADKRYSERDRYRMYREFGAQIRASKQKNPDAKLVAAYQCLLDLAEKEELGDAAKMLDQVVCDAIEGYKTSVQREQVARRLSRSGDEYYKNHFNKIKNEIEQVPVAKRTNLQFQIN